MPDVLNQTQRGIIVDVNQLKEGELSESMTIPKMETVVQRGFRGAVHEMVDFYKLDAIK